MKRKRTSSVHCFFVFLFILLVITSSSVMSVESVKNKKQKNQRRGQHATPPRVPHYSPTEPAIFDVLSFGAKGDGDSDDSLAFLAAWEAACKVSGATLKFPSEFNFLIKPITLQGPCMPGLILQIDGVVLAPANVWSGPKSDMLQWINFKWLHNFTIQGAGTVDGQGSVWWTASTDLFDFSKKKSSKINGDISSKISGDVIPTALRFYASYNVTVRDVKIINSPNCHLKFDNSRGVDVHSLTISAPETSTNTDGIHLQNSHDVQIHHSNIGCGDDCVSIQTGCTNIHVHHINCGPGHGISIGGLGKGGSIACVSDIVVENIFMNNTLYAARIKTWQGGMGAVQNVSFSNIRVSNVKVPVMIDQYYCDKHFCKNQSGAVAITGITFDQISGTYTAEPLHLACSNSVPCSDVKLSAIHLQPSPGISRGQLRQALCWNSFGKSQPPLVPSTIDYCARKGSRWLQRIAKSHESRC